MHLGSLSGAAEGETGQGVQGVCAPGWGPLSPVAVHILPVLLVAPAMTVLPGTGSCWFQV